jgi:hypothetical protein
MLLADLHGFAAFYPIASLIFLIYIYIYIIINSGSFKAAKLISPAKIGGN